MIGMLDGRREGSVGGVGRGREVPEACQPRLCIGACEVWGLRVERWGRVCGRKGWRGGRIQFRPSFVASAPRPPAKYPLS